MRGSVGICAIAEAEKIVPSQRWCPELHLSTGSKLSIFINIQWSSRISATFSTNTSAQISRSPEEFPNILTAKFGSADRFDNKNAFGTEPDFSTSNPSLQSFSLKIDTVKIDSFFGYSQPLTCFSFFIVCVTSFVNDYRNFRQSHS